MTNQVYRRKSCGLSRRAGIIRRSRAGRKDKTAHQFDTIRNRADETTKTLPTIQLNAIPADGASIKQQYTHVRSIHILMRYQVETNANAGLSRPSIEAIGVFGSYVSAWYGVMECRIGLRRWADLDDSLPPSPAWAAAAQAKFDCFFTRWPQIGGTSNQRLRV